mmetsp:Transcript_27845/g.81740  ORF Transcript_27845/g.81740 Transcript_27845/m.81740 type:complete len:97 (-) Transcript_27845:219-509(-)
MLPVRPFRPPLLHPQRRRPLRRASNAAGGENDAKGDDNGGEEDAAFRFTIAAPFAAPLPAAAAKRKRAPSRGRINDSTARMAPGTMRTATTTSGFP